MKISITDGIRRFSVSVPTRLIFSRVSVKLLTGLSSRYMDLQSLSSVPPETLYALCAEIGRIKKKHGIWELVNVESANGESVRIVL